MLTQRSFMPSYSNNQIADFEPEFRFTDTTILQADGEYSVACRLMKDEPHPWCLNSRLTVIHPFGVCEMQLEFFDDGALKIVEFRPSVPDPLLCYDLRCLRAWASANGWGTPVPSKHVVNMSLPFWKHQWQVYAVDCPDLDARYGERPEIEFRETNTRRDDEPEEQDEGQQAL